MNVSNGKSNRLGRSVARRSVLAAALLLGAVISFRNVAVASPGPPPVSAAEYASRRERVLQRLEEQAAPRALLLVRSPEPARFANDVHYPYRPDNDVFYLTGIADKGVALLLSTREIEGLGRAVLFLVRGSEFEALWIGKRTTPAEAAAISGLSEAAVVEPSRLAELLRDALPRPRWSPHGTPGRSPRAALYFELGRPFDPGETPTPPYGFLLETLGSSAFALDLRTPRQLTHPLRQVKSPGELLLLRKAIDATCVAHRRAMALARAGLFEYHLAAEIEATFRKEGCGGWAFPSIVGSGPNSCVLHYERYDRELADGDLVVMDIGAEYGFYAADITRTIPVSGRFTERQKAMYRIVLAAQDAVFAALKPGMTIDDVNRIARNVIAEGLIEQGVITSADAARRYLPHGVSHGIGLAVHDPIVSELEPGMTITVEPGIYIAEEALGIRIEDDVLITENGCEVLSLDAPRTIEEVERAMNSARF